jgi:hypothetical protein
MVIERLDPTFSDGRDTCRASQRFMAERPRLYVWRWRFIFSSAIITETNLGFFTAL